MNNICKCDTCLVYHNHQMLYTFRSKLANDKFSYRVSTSNKYYTIIYTAYGITRKRKESHTFIFLM